MKSTKHSCFLNYKFEFINDEEFFILKRVSMSTTILFSYLTISFINRC